MGSKLISAQLVSGPKDLHISEAQFLGKRPGDFPWPILAIALLSPTRRPNTVVAVYTVVRIGRLAMWDIYIYIYKTSSTWNLGDGKENDQVTQISLKLSGSSKLEVMSSPCKTSATEKCD